MVLATALFDKAPFRNCICHGIVLDENKQKLSKRLKNYPDPVAVFNTYGADALRWYMVSSPLLSGGDLAMPKDGHTIAETVRQVLLPLWNAYSFFTLYANIDGIRASFAGQQNTDGWSWKTTVDSDLDIYILDKTGDLVRSVEAAMDRLDLAGACALLPPFIEALNNWYIRRSRDRFWKAEKDADKKQAYDTLYSVLVTLCRTMAPFLPYLTEYIHRSLTGGESVHLQDWPTVSQFPADVDLLERMDLAREVCSAAASLRTAKNLRNRLPLRRLTVAHPRHAVLEPLRDVIAEEANVKEIMFADDPAKFGAEVLVVNPRIVGKRLGPAMKDVLAASKSGAWKKLPDGAIEVAGQRIEVGEYELRFKATEGLDATSFAGSAGVVALDTTVDAELEREGVARDFIRLVQVARKDAGFKIADRIHIELKASPATNAAITAHEAMVRGETLALSLTPAGHPAGFVSEARLQDEPVAIGVRLAG
jgi:isoleucyl-tRNA synthetase